MIRNSDHRIAWATIVLSILLVLYSSGGVAAVAPLEVSSPEYAARYRFASQVYAAMAVLGLITLVGAVYYLIRGRRSAAAQRVQPQQTPG